MGLNPPYGPPIKDAISSGSLTKMKAMLKKAKKFSEQQGNLSLAIIELQEAIEKLEHKK